MYANKKYLHTWRWTVWNQNIISFGKQFYVVLWIYFAFSSCTVSKIKILHTFLMALKRIDSRFYTLSIVEQNIEAIRFNFRLLFFSCHIQFRTFFCIDFSIQWIDFFFQFGFSAFWMRMALNKRKALSTLTHAHKTAEVERREKKWIEWFLRCVQTAMQLFADGRQQLFGRIVWLMENKRQYWPTVNGWKLKLYAIGMMGFLYRSCCEISGPSKRCAEWQYNSLFNVRSFSRRFIYSFFLFKIILICCLQHLW